MDYFRIASDSEEKNCRRNAFQLIRLKYPCLPEFYIQKYVTRKSCWNLGVCKNIENEILSLKKNLHKNVTNKKKCTEKDIFEDIELFCKDYFNNHDKFSNSIYRR
jgi:hypothetical protein